jgi:tetratricopeptide (TPR) repeat protein
MDALPEQSADHAEELFGEYGVSNISMRTPKHFLGRDEEMAALKAGLESENAPVPVAVLHGVSGVGKTTLAMAYANSHRAEFRVIWRIGARTESTIRADLADLAAACSWSAPKCSEPEATNAALSRLRSEGKGFLLIYDDAADSELVRRYLPSKGEAKAIVIFEAHRGDFGQSIELFSWPKIVGSKFLLAHASTDRPAEAGNLSAALGGLPLAHALAAAYCKQLGVSFAEYRRRLERTTTRHSGDGEPSESGEHQIIAKTFALGVGEAQRRHPAAGRLMEYAALLAAEPIPLFFFSEGRLPLMPVVEAGMKRSRVLRRWTDGLWRAFKRHSRKTKRSGDGARGFFRPISGEDLDGAIRALTDFALADRTLIADQRDPERLTPTLALPRLVRNAAAKFASGKVKAELIKAMLSIYPESLDAEQRPRARWLGSSVLELTHGDVPADGAEKDASLLLGKIARYHQYALKDYEEAQPFFEKSLSFAEAGFGPEHQATAVLLSDFSALLMTLGGRENLDRARDCLVRALMIDEKTFGEGHPSISTRHSNLALVLREIGGVESFRLAKRHLMRALAIDEKALGPGHPNVAVRYSNLAALLQDFGGAEHMEIAKDCLARALMIDEQAFGDDHPYVAIRLSSLAAALKEQGGERNLRLAKEYLTRALLIDENAYGREHSHVGVRLSNLALALKDLGGAENLEAAEECLTRALTIDKMTIGEDHPEHAKHLSNLALVIKDRGGIENLRRAEKRMTQALVVDEKALGAEHSNVAVDLWLLASVLRAIGGTENLELAKEKLTRAQAILRRALGSEYPTTQRVSSTLADVFTELEGDN